MRQQPVAAVQQPTSIITLSMQSATVCSPRMTLAWPRSQRYGTPGNNLGTPYHSAHAEHARQCHRSCFQPLASFPASRCPVSPKQLNNAQSGHTPSNIGRQCQQLCAVLCSPPQQAADSLCCVAQPSRLNQLWLGDRSQFKYSSRQPVRRRRGDVHGDLSNVVLNFHWAGEWPDTWASGCVWQAQQPVSTLAYHAGLGFRVRGVASVWCFCRPRVNIFSCWPASAPLALSPSVEVPPICGCSPSRSPEGLILTKLDRLPPTGLPHCSALPGVHAPPACVPQTQDLHTPQTDTHRIHAGQEADTECRLRHSSSMPSLAQSHPSAQAPKPAALWRLARMHFITFPRAHRAARRARWAVLIAAARAQQQLQAADPQKGLSGVQLSADARQACAV